MAVLTNIQYELKAPKNQYNSFGNYNYRNCEDILEALKPLLKKYNCSLIISDEVVMIGNRFYVKATATLYNENNEVIGQASAFAREPETVKGQGEAQVTGASSSYARKYALNGLFDIDDTKDSDTTNVGDSKPTPKPSKPPLSKAQRIQELIKGTEVTAEQIREYNETNFGKGVKVNDLTEEQFNKLYTAISKFINGEE